jgi:uncharacterized membrane protein YhhN
MQDPAMLQLVPIPFIALSVTLLVHARLRSNQGRIYFFKPLSTLLVILVAALSFTRPAVQFEYTTWIIVGLSLSLGGDVALMFRSSGWFIAGLVLFLLAHVVYAGAFTVPNGFHPQDLVVGLCLAVAGVVVYLYLKPGLGSMRGPVIVYILIICLMVNRAISTFFGETFTTTQAWLISLGASLFWISDLLLAVNRFRRPLRLEAFGLYLYYGGQLLIALSPSYF